jgi:hypothetical protein
LLQWQDVQAPSRLGARRMSLYQVQQCLFDYLRAIEAAQSGPRPEIQLEGYELTDAERKALSSGDVGAFYTMGVHPVIINGYCRAMGYKRADYRPLLAGVAPRPRRTRWQTS